jgi:hypothetical protein
MYDPVTAIKLTIEGRECEALLIHNDHSEVRGNLFIISGVRRIADRSF